MLSLQITAMKPFMSQLLTSDTFDLFLLKEASVHTSVNTTIDGQVNRNFYSSQDAEEGLVPEYDFQPWSNLKGLCFYLIKGKRTPLYFKFIFYLKPELARTLLTKENCSADLSLINALVLNIRFDGTKTILSTGVAYSGFVLSKEADQIWDQALCRYLTKKELAYEPLL